MLLTHLYDPEEVERARSEARAKAERRKARVALPPDPGPKEAGSPALRGKTEPLLSLFFSCHGGTGCTTLVASLATLLARAERSVCVVDCDLQFGDTLMALNLKHRFTLAQALEALPSLDPETLHYRLPRHESGVCVLSQAGDVDGLGQIEPSTFIELLALLRESFDHVLVDGVRDFSDYALAVLDVADDVLLVGTQEVPAVRGMAMRLDVFEQLGYEVQWLDVVINRYATKNGVSLGAIANSLEVETRFVIADDAPVARRALNDGVPLVDMAPTSRATRDMQDLVQVLYGVHPPRRKGLFGRIFGGSA
ncbi:MAG: AAA family ATPase [Deltaproteobacteria bacterium]|nr:AAA family ATPase [Deltaproteobacteria bacterium]